LIVLDASVLANAVGDDGASGELARSRLLTAVEAAIPDLADVETVAVLRKRWLTGGLTTRRFRSAIEDLLELPLARFPAAPLLLRAYELRENVTAYDACYIALAEGLGCTLVTADARLARAPRIRCDVEVLSDFAG
jgi:predicted nucleic acid-binding protein